MTCLRSRSSPFNEADWSAKSSCLPGGRCICAIQIDSVSVMSPAITGNGTFKLEMYARATGSESDTVWVSYAHGIVLYRSPRSRLTLSESVDLFAQSVARVRLRAVTMGALAKVRYKMNTQERVRIIIVVLVPRRSQRTVRLMSGFISDRPRPHQWRSPTYALI